MISNTMQSFPLCSIHLLYVLVESIGVCIIQDLSQEVHCAAIGKNKKQKTKRSASVNPSLESLGFQLRFAM